MSRQYDVDDATDGIGGMDIKENSAAGDAEDAEYNESPDGHSGGQVATADGKKISEEYLCIMQELQEQYKQDLKEGRLTDPLRFERIANTYEVEKYGDHKVIVSVKDILNPLDYAWLKHEVYIKNRMPQKISVLFVGMNPSPHVPSGIPFGDKDAFFDFWRSEIEFQGIPEFSAEDESKCVSGRRFWKFVKQYFRDGYYQEHCFVMNFSPLIFVGDLTRVIPKLKKVESGNVPLNNFDGPTTHALVKSLMQKSRNELVNASKKMEPNLIVAIGGYAYTKVRNLGFRVKSVTHPSPANPKHPDNPNDPDLGDNMWISTIKDELKDIDWKALVKDKSGNN